MPNNIENFFLNFFTFMLGTLQRNPIYVLPEKELRGLSPNFHIYVSVSDLYIPRIGPHIFLQQKADRLWEYINRMNVEIGTEGGNSCAGNLFRIFGIVSLQCSTVFNSFASVFFLLA